MKGTEGKQGVRDKRQKQGRWRRCRSRQSSESRESKIPRTQGLGGKMVKDGGFDLECELGVSGNVSAWYGAEEHN